MIRIHRQMSALLLCAVLAFVQPARAQFDLLAARTADRVAASKYFMIHNDLLSMYETGDLSLPVSTSTSGILHVASTHKTTAVREGTAAPQYFELCQNFPNPFNMSTKIVYSIPVQSTVSLIVYDITGRQVAALVNGPVAPGTHEAIFDMHTIASGAYYYRIIAAGQAGEMNVQTKKMIVLK